MTRIGQLTSAHEVAGGWVKVLAPAKINLTLHVTGRRPDGYHLLDSLVGFADIGDVVRVRPATEMSLTITGPLAAGIPGDHTNLAWKAAAFLGTPPVDIVLEKHLPAAAGIGGGSSDAAAVLRALSYVFDKPLGASSGFTSLGADVPVCVDPGLWRMQGVGERLTRVSLASGGNLGVVLANPQMAIATEEVFKNLEKLDRPSMSSEDLQFESVDDLINRMAGWRNDLEATAVGMCPQIGDVLNVLRSQDAVHARMSGSGATCFALCASRERAEEIRITMVRNHPNWWIAAGELLLF